MLKPRRSRPASPRTSLWPGKTNRQILVPDAYIEIARQEGRIEEAEKLLPVIEGLLELVRRMVAIRDGEKLEAWLKSNGFGSYYSH